YVAGQAAIFEARAEHLAKLERRSALLKKGMTKEEVIGLLGEQPTDQVHEMGPLGQMNYLTFSTDPDPELLHDLEAGVAFLRASFDEDDRLGAWYVSNSGNVTQKLT